MSGISVIQADGDIQSFPEATTWHIDDRGQLHLNSEAGQVASFAKDMWQGAGTTDPNAPVFNAQMADNALLHHLGRIDNELRAIRMVLDGSAKASGLLS